MTISESIIASAKVGAEQAQPMSDLEKAARAICMRLGWDADCIAYARPVHQTHVADRAYVFTLPLSDHSAPLWTFFTAEAEAALSVLDI